MIQTLRDAELRIKQLERDVEMLKKQVRIATNSPSSSNVSYSANALGSGISVNGGSPAILVKTDSVSSADAEISADGQVVVHKLDHFFNNLKAEILEATIGRFSAVEAKDVRIYEPTMVAPGSGIWQLTEVGDVTNPLGRDLFIIGPYGHIFLDFRYTNPAMGIDPHILVGPVVSKIVPQTDILTDLGEVSRRYRDIFTARILANDQITYGANQVYRSSVLYTGKDIFHETFVEGVTAGTGTIFYKDWSGNNVSASVVIGVTPITKTVHFAGGLRVDI